VFKENTDIVNFYNKCEQVDNTYIKCGNTSVFVRSESHMSKILRFKFGMWSIITLFFRPDPDYLKAW